MSNRVRICRRIAWGEGKQRDGNRQGNQSRIRADSENVRSAQQLDHHPCRCTRDSADNYALKLARIASPRVW